MKKLIHKLFILSLFCLVFILDISAQSNTVKIATFNCEFLTRPKVHIKFGLPFDIKTAADSIKALWEDDSYRAMKFKEAVVNVAAFLKTINADVLALTEVGDSSDIEVLKNELKNINAVYNYSAVCNSYDRYTTQHVAVLSKYELKDIEKEISGREYYLPETDDPETEKNTGLSKGMKVKFDAYDKEFLLYVIHLASERGGYEQDEQRIAQASIVRRNYLPELKNGENIIVAGDFNDYRGQPALKRIRGFDDIEGDLIQTGNKYFFAKNKLDTRWTYEFEGIRQQIDHVLLSFSIKNICKAHGGIKAEVIDHNNKNISDHRPFVVTLKLKN